MDLKAVAKKPKLQKISLDSDHVVATYGESLDFYMYDRYDMPTYIRLSAVDQTNTGEMLAVIQDLVLDEGGKTMLAPDDQLPPAVMVDMMNAVVAQLGNLDRQTLAA